MTSDDETQVPAAEGGGDIVVECLHCGRRSTLRSETVADDVPLVQITRRLKCSGCGSRSVKAARVQSPRDVARLIRNRMRSGRS